MATPADISYQTEGIPGTWATTTLVKDAISRNNGEASDEIPFGVGVTWGTDKDEQVEHIDAQADILAGISLQSQAYERSIELGTIGVKPGYNLAVARHGVMRVYVDEAVAVGDAVRYRADTNAGAVGAVNGPGTFCKSSAAGHTVLITSGAKWVKGNGGAAGIAHLEINMTSLTVTSD